MMNKHDWTKKVLPPPRIKTKCYERLKEWEGEEVHIHYRKEQLHKLISKTDRATIRKVLEKERKYLSSLLGNNSDGSPVTPDEGERKAIDEKLHKIACAAFLMEN